MTSEKEGYEIDNGATTTGVHSRDTIKTTTEGTWSGLPPLGDQSEVPELTVALTPENLPVLLDYLRTCERMLGEWKVRAGSLLTVSERGEQGVQ